MKVVFNTIVTPANSKIGVGGYIDNLFEALLNEHPDDAFYGLVNQKYPAFESKALNYVAIPLGANPQPSPLLAAWQPSFANQVSAVSADIYHLPNTSPLLFHRCPTIASILDLQEFKVQKYSRVRTMYRRLANWSVTRVADAILTISENSKADIVKFLGVDPERVHVTYLAQDATYRKIEENDAILYVKQEYNIQDYILTVGDISPGKNLTRLVEAYAQLRYNGEKRALVFVGKERNHFAKLHNLIEELRLTASVKFLGYVSLEDLVYLYNAAATVAYPSLYEGFGLPILEAMACGTSIATSNVSSIPEVAGSAGVLFDPYDVEDIVAKLTRLLGDEDFRQNRIHAGLQQVKKFSWQKTAHQTMAVYKHLQHGELAAT